MNFSAINRTKRAVLTLGVLLLAVLASPAVTAMDFTASEEGLVLTREERNRMKNETVLAIDFIQRNHYKRKSFGEIPADELLRNYMEELDYSHLFFTKTDAEEIRMRFEPTLKPVYLSKGDTTVKATNVTV